MRITSLPRRDRFAAGVGAFKTALNLMGIFDSPQMPEPILPLDAKNSRSDCEGSEGRGNALRTLKARPNGRAFQLPLREIGSTNPSAEPG